MLQRCLAPSVLRTGSLFDFRLLWASRPPVSWALMVSPLQRWGNRGLIKPCDGGYARRSRGEAHTRRSRGFLTTVRPAAPFKCPHQGLPKLPMWRRPELRPPGVERGGSLAQFCLIAPQTKHLEANNWSKYLWYLHIGCRENMVWGYLDFYSVHSALQ